MTVECLSLLGGKCVQKPKCEHACAVRVMPRFADSFVGEPRPLLRPLQPLTEYDVRRIVRDELSRAAASLPAPPLSDADGKGSAK